MAFTATLAVADGRATVELKGELDATAAPKFHEKIEEAMRADVSRLEIHADDLTYISSAGLRSLLFAQQKMGEQGAIVLMGASPLVVQTIRVVGLDRSIEIAAD